MVFDPVIHIQQGWYLHLQYEKDKVDEDSVNRELCLYFGPPKYPVLLLITLIGIPCILFNSLYSLNFLQCIY